MFNRRRSPTTERLLPVAEFRPIVLVLLVGIGLAALGPTARAAEDLYDTAAGLADQYAERLEALSTWCDEEGLTEQAETTRSWLRPRNPYYLYVTLLPSKVGKSPPPEGAPANVVQWHDRFGRLRSEQAEALFTLARRAIIAHHSSLAFDLLMAAIRENPDHPTIRRILGYQKYQSQWRTRYEVGRLRKGQVWHERFGWLPRNYVRRYEEGDRYFGGRWISAEEDARRHYDIRVGWDVETEHYVIRTNHSLEAGVDLGRQLERVYRVWKQLFVRFYASEEAVGALFSSGARGKGIRLTKRHAMVFFRNRDDYNRSLGPMIPGIEISIGAYVQKMQRAYFFAGKAFDRRTLYHEATHQLFHESRPVADSVGGRANFWIVEGIATYMESLRDEAECHVLGGLNDLRMQEARFRLVKDRFYVPFSQFSALGMKGLQADPRIGALYSQAAGMTHFLIHYDRGRYRDALVAYLGGVYSGHDMNLAQLTGTPFEELDRQYQEFMRHGLEKHAPAEEHAP